MLVAILRSLSKKIRYKLQRYRYKKVFQVTFFTSKNILQITFKIISSQFFLYFLQFFRSSSKIIWKIIIINKICCWLSRLKKVQRRHCSITLMYLHNMAMISDEPDWFSTRLIMEIIHPSSKPQGEFLWPNVKKWNLFLNQWRYQELLNHRVALGTHW